MFKECSTKPVVKPLCEILEGDKVTNTNEKGVFKLTRGDDSVKFSASKKPAVGDFIIMQSEDDIYHCPADTAAEKYYLDGAPEPEAAGECEKCAELEEEKQLLLESNDKLEAENEALRAGNYEEPFEYNPEKIENLSFKEAKAACEEDGKAATRKAWNGIYMTHDAKKGLMVHVRGTNPKPIAPDKASLEAKDFYVLENV